MRIDMLMPTASLKTSVRVRKMSYECGVITQLLSTPGAKNLPLERDSKDFRLCRVYTVHAVIFQPYSCNVKAAIDST